MPSGTTGIYEQSLRNTKITTDLDNFRNRYLDVDVKNNIRVTFPSFDIRTFDRNYYTILSRSRKVDFISPRWKMRPDFTSFDFFFLRQFTGLSYCG